MRGLDPRIRRFLPWNLPQQCALPRDGYGMGHSGMGLGGLILVVLLVLLLLGKL